MKIWTDKLKEVVMSIFPITALVTILNFTLLPLETGQFIRFLLGSLLIMTGLTVFLVGVDRSITMFGNQMGEVIIRGNKLWIVAVSGLLLGFFISVAEPDLHILADQVELVTTAMMTKWSLVIVVSLGIAFLIAIGLVRILYGFPLYKLFAIIYGVIFLLSLFSSSGFLAISFDSSGATTGALTVPFMLALAYGVALKKKDSKAAEKDSFGLVGIASAGAIIAVLITSLIVPKREFASAIEFSEEYSDNIIMPFVQQILEQLLDVLIAVLPIFLIFLICQPFLLKLKSRVLRSMTGGFLYVWIGLILLFTGVNAGFMEIGREIGSRLVVLDNKAYVIIVGFLLGLLTILAEPAVHVLTSQIEEVTSGSVKRPAVLAALTVGVGTAVALSVLRILIPSLQLWHILLPGYIISVFFVIYRFKAVCRHCL